MADVIDSMKVTIAWEKARNSYHSIMTMFEKNDAKYRDRCSFWQQVIKKVMEKHSIAVPVAVIWVQENILKEEDNGMGLLALLASGYELLVNNDFTITKEE